MYLNIIRIGRYLPSCHRSPARLHHSLSQSDRLHNMFVKGGICCSVVPSFVFFIASVVLHQFDVAFTSKLPNALSMAAISLSNVFLSVALVALMSLIWPRHHCANFCESFRLLTTALELLMWPQHCKRRVTLAKV
jgi:hypothetical protein